MKSEEEKEAGTNILRKYGSFFKKQHKDFTLLDKNVWVENKTYQPIYIKMEPKEIITIPNLVSSDNTLMNKVLGVLSSLCIEVMALRNEAFEKHFCFLSVYDEYNNNDMESQIEPICLLSAFITRCNDTLKNICSQVFAIFTESVINLNKIQLHYIINHIGELFTVLVILELLLSNSSIARNWIKYCKNFKTLIHKYKSDIDLSYEKISALSDAVGNITTKVMNGDIVLSALSNILTLRSSLTDKNSSIVATEFSQYIKQAIINLDKLVQEKPSVNNMYKCIKLNALFVLSSQLFGTLDKKTFKTLLELDAKVHSIYIIGATMWFPEQFLQRHVPSMSGSYNKLSHTMLKARQSYITVKKTCVNRDLVTLQNLSSQWILNMELTFSEEHYELNASEMSHQAKILFEGLDVASHIQYYVLTLINLHLTLSVPLSKNMLMAIFEIIDILKSLQNIVTRHHCRITKSTNMILQHLTYQATSAILQVKKTLMTDKNYANKRLDDLTCLVIAERALRGTTTIERNIAANVALSFVPDTTYVEDTYAKLGNLLEKITTLSNFLNLMDNFGNCYWMLWHQNVLPIYFEQNFSATENVLRLKYFLMVLDDCVLFLNKTDKLNNENKSQQFFNTMKCLIEESFLKNIGQSIETNLRLQIHSHLQLQAVNPFTNEMIKKLLFAVDSFRLHTIYMGVIPTVEHYLSTMYYNLTTVVLSDWKTYGEMRQMAKFKFNLLTVQDNLPTQTLEQGLDVLEIMRNIHIFVSRYNYNLNNQIFIEKSSNNKHLNSINIKHIANSIRTHGTGIMNTTVNFTYQFLKKKFFTFSQFMYDEHIKSRLYKDCRNFKENSIANANMYPYKSAEKFNKGIRLLGLAENGQTYLDLFRDLISQIGNAMGYVRMIRTGGRHCCSDATMFLPNLECKGVSTELIVESNYTSKTIESAENFNDNINDLLTNFLQGTEYFKLLVNVFAPVFRNPKNIHLKNFYIIIPPLTLNFVEHMILSKDKMSKKNKSGASFSDDGFAMGVAYILKLLDQETQFEALHWFDSVWSYIQNERKALDEQMDKGPVQLQQALALTEKKINTLETEFKLLYYSFCSARIFFK